MRIPTASTCGYARSCFPRVRTWQGRFTRWRCATSAPARRLARGAGHFANPLGVELLRIPRQESVVSRIALPAGPRYESARLRQTYCGRVPLGAKVAGRARMGTRAQPDRQPRIAGGRSSAMTSAAHATRGRAVLTPYTSGSLGPCGRTRRHDAESEVPIRRGDRPRAAAQGWARVEFR